MDPTFMHNHLRRPIYVSQLYTPQNQLCYAFGFIVLLEQHVISKLLTSNPNCQPQRKGKKVPGYWNNLECSNDPRGYVVWGLNAPGRVSHGKQALGDGSDKDWFKNPS
ncbi:hypothetical protein AMECASPLE_013996 [Ameca splendens]|uniref:Uncharacterized protein n=1 Tax=Ameca splendens TaxID=208324 RepID=A0ABV0XEP4_9TELE